MIAKTLKDWMLLYNVLWNDWLNYKHNGLNENEISIITTQLRNNFEIPPGIVQSRMYYNKPETLEAITEKLRRSYPDYKYWLIMKFFFLILKQYGGRKVSRLNIPIGEMNIEPELKAILIQFNHPTLESLFTSSYEFEFLKQGWFTLIRRFLLTYNDLHLTSIEDKRTKRVKRRRGVKKKNKVVSLQLSQSSIKMSYNSAELGYEVFLN